MDNIEKSANFYRELSMKCDKELTELLNEKKRRDASKLKTANFISVVSFILTIIALICVGVGMFPIGIVIIPVIGIIYGIITTPSGNDIDREYWDMKMEILTRYLKTWQRSEYYCNLPYQYVHDFREISIEFRADLSGIRFKPSHKLYR